MSIASGSIASGSIASGGLEDVATGVSGTIASLSLTAPTASVSISANGSIHSLALSAPAASTSINPSASIHALDLTEPSATAGIAPNGDIDPLDLIQPFGFAASISNGNAFGSIHSLDLTPPDANANISKTASTSIAALDLAPPSATGSESASGDINSLSLSSPTAIVGFEVFGDFDALDITAPDGVGGISGEGSGDIALLSLSAIDGYSSLGSVTGTGDIAPLDLVAPTATALSEYLTHKSIIWQYSSSPIIKQLVHDKEVIFNSTDLYSNFYRLIWDVRTANSFGLDILGRIVGVSRYLNLTNTEFFGFEPDFTPFDDKPFYHGHEATTQYRLSNDLYRKVILAKAANNISGPAIPDIERVLFILFGDKGKSIVKITDFAELTYEFHFAPEPIDQAIIEAPGLLPKPAGHKIIKTFV